MKTSESNCRTLRAFASVALVLALAACGGGKTVVESNLRIAGAPDWVNKGTNVLNDKNGRLFHGVGSSPAMGDDSLQRSTADERARAEVARIFSSYMDVVTNDYTASTGLGADASAEQAVSRQVKATTKLNLSGSKIIGRWKDSRTDIVYSICELDLQHVKGTVQGAKDMNEDLRRYFDRNAENVFDKVSARESRK
jgi:hypothetical protein